MNVTRSTRLYVVLPNGECSVPPVLVDYKTSIISDGEIITAVLCPVSVRSDSSKSEFHFQEITVAQKTVSMFPDLNIIAL